jgi:RNA polymerase sigma-70 factor (ECF subfamily)
MATDAVLLERMRAGYEAAFEALFQQHYQRVYSLLYRLVGDEADDLAQEVFLRLYYRPPAKPDSDLAAWLFRVATNLGYNALRSRRRLETHRDALGSESVGSAWQGDAPSPEAWAEQREIEAHVRAALARLGRHEATVLTLRYSGLSYREVAQVLGVSPGSVGTLLARAERAFEKAYGYIMERHGQSGGGQ